MLPFSMYGTKCLWVCYFLDVKWCNSVLITGLNVLACNMFESINMSVCVTAAGLGKTNTVKPG
jgi:hypothetical protein